MRHERCRPTSDYGITLTQIAVTRICQFEPVEMFSRAATVHEPVADW